MRRDRSVFGSRNRSSPLAGDGIRLRDLRHAFGSALLEAGIHPKVASEALGGKLVAFTMDTYQHLLPTMGSQVAAAIETALVAPSRREVARATGVAQSTRQRPKCLQQMCGLLATTSPSQRKTTRAALSSGISAGRFL